jgi:hypothetical protein
MIVNLISFVLFNNRLYNFIFVKNIVLVLSFKFSFANLKLFVINEVNANYL